MRTTAPLLLLVLALLAWAGIAWLGSGTEPKPHERSDPGPAIPVADEPTPPPVEPVVLDAMAYDETLQPDPGSDELPPPERSEVVLDNSQVAGPGPLVVVLQGNPPRPVAGAKVAFVPLAEGQARRQRANQPWLHDLDLPARFGIQATADQDGKVQLPPIQEPTLLSAVHEGQFATASVPRGRQGELRLRLRPDETVTVIVRNGPGEPAAGVPVAIFQGVNFGRAQQVWLGPTGPDGVAAVTHFQEHRRKQDGKRFCAALRVPLPFPVAQEFEGVPAPADPIHLVVQPTGAIELTLVDRAGNPLLCEATIALGLVRPDGFSLPVPVDQRFDWLLARKPLGEGPIAFPMVGLGLELRAGALIAEPTNKHWFQSPPLRTAPQAGGTARSPVPLPADFTVLAGLLYGEDGRPLAGSPSFALGVPGGRTVTGTLRSLPDGRFDLAMRLPEPSAFHALELALPHGQGVQGLRLELGALHPGERRELGVLRLCELPLLAHGRTVNDTGEPVSGAQVSLQRFTRIGNREGWFDASLSHTKADAEGRFVLQGNVPPGQLRVRARMSGHFDADSPPISPGTELLLTLMRAGSIAGQVLLPEWLPDDAANLQLVPHDDPKRAQGAALRASRGGRFAIGSLRPGRYDAVVRMRNLPDPASQIYGIAIGPGGNEDRRLQPLDLRQSLFRYRLRALGAGGRPLPQLEGPVLVRTMRPDGSRADLGFRWQKGRAEVITQSPMIEVIAFGKGYPPTAFTLGPGDHDVYLQELHPAVIHLPGARALCGPGRAVRVSMIFQGETGLPDWLNGIDQRSGEQFSLPRWELSRSGGAWLGDGDTVAVPLSRGGKHEVILRIYEDARQNGPQVSVTVGVADVVVDGPAPVERTLPLDAAKIAEAVQQLERQRQQRLEQQRLQPQQRPPGRGR